jgi:uncharacterized protein (DUF2147 family)
MIKIAKRTLKAAALVLAVSAGPALASEPTGVWMDHTGTGAVEITRCGAGLCGRVVWVKDQADRSACGMQIIGGNAKEVAGGRWDGGWIYDPEVKRKYSVELTAISAGQLKVTGYQGSKLFSETMMWRRAPADLKRCNA